MKDKIRFIFCFLFIANYSIAQNTSIKIDLKFNDNSIVIGKQYKSINNDTLSFETIRFYLSSFEINYKDNSTYKEVKSYHLIDINKPESLLINFKNSTNAAIKSIKFNVGIDSLTSVSGAMANDLDATNGMYWAWQSGFINMKIEGKSKSCKTRNNQFNFHIGGYLIPNYALRNIVLKLNENTNANTELLMKVDLSKLFNSIDLSKNNSVMIPGNEAMKIANQSVKMFSIE